MQRGVCSLANLAFCVSGLKRPPELEEPIDDADADGALGDGGADDAPAPVAGLGDADPAVQGRLGAGADADEPRSDAAAALPAR